MVICLLLLIVSAVAFGFMTGFHDASNIVATMIASRALSPRRALVLTTICETLGPCIFGVAVANTIGHDIISGDTVTLAVVIAALLGAIVWSLLTWWMGIPSSSSHALIGGIIGAAAIEHGFGVIHIAGLKKILLALFISPFIGLVVGFILQRLILNFMVAVRAEPRANNFFRAGQIFTGCALGLSHGANDAQKTMGMIAMGLVATGFQKQFAVSWWIIAIGAASIGAGTAAGGYRLIKTLGFKLYKIWPIHGFTTQFASAAVILTAALAGGPVSTTQVVSGAILGVGASENIRKVRWQMAANIAMSWILTIPAAGGVAAGIYCLVKYFMKHLGGPL